MDSLHASGLRTSRARAGWRVAGCVSLPLSFPLLAHVLFSSSSISNHSLSVTHSSLVGASSTLRLADVVLLYL
jgi:hypothetical protein